MVQINSQTEKILYDLSSSILKFEYLVPILIVLFALLVFINIKFFISRKKASMKPYLSTPTSVDTKKKNFFLNVVKNLQIPALIFLNALVVSFIAGGIFYTFWVPPWIIKSDPEFNGVWADSKKPIEVEFNSPIDIKRVKVNISPEIKGQWVFPQINKFIPVVRKIQFLPEETVFPEQPVVVYITGIAPLGKAGDGYETSLEFSSPKIPEIISIDPVDKTERAPVDKPVTVGFNDVGKSYAKWKLESSPATEYEIVEIDEKKMQFKFKQPLSQSTEYKVKISVIPVKTLVSTGEVIEEGEKKVEKEFSFTTVKTPGFASYEPKGSGILINVPIKVVFDQEMDKAQVEKNFSLEPSIPVKFEWQDEKSLTIKPESNFNKNTTYKVKFAKGIPSKIEGVTQNDIGWEFTTIGHVAVIDVNPNNGYSSASVGTNISIAFNQKVDHGSAQSKFSISPSVSGAFSWNGNTMTFNPSGNLAYQVTYNYTVASGVKTIDGLDSNKSFSYKFTTIPEKVVLGVPYYHQQTNFTCNVASARMALAYYKVYRSEGDIRAGIGEQPSKYSGGNPNVGWVPDYGVFWGPVASYINRYRTAVVKRGWNINDLAREVQAGHPVILWWHNRYSPAVWDVYPAFTGLRGMHSEVVKGFKGSPDNPIQFYTNDPWRGNLTYSASAFNSLWGYFNRTAIVVY